MYQGQTGLPALSIYPASEVAVLPGQVCWTWDVWTLPLGGLILFRCFAPQRTLEAALGELVFLHEPCHALFSGERAVQVVVVDSLNSLSCCGHSGVSLSPVAPATGLGRCLVIVEKAVHRMSKSVVGNHRLG